MPGNNKIQKNPLISAIIPVYNGEQFIRDAIQSILDQNFHELEILIIDDGSTDRTKDIVRVYKDQIRYFHQTNQGPASARNTGLKLARGKIIGFLDADDIWPSARLDMMMEKFDQNPSVEIVMGHTQSQALSNVRPIHPNLLLPHIMPLFGCGLFNRNVFEKVGCLDPTLNYSEDQDWFLRAKELNISIMIVKDVVLIRRLHDDNMTQGVNWKEAGILSVLRKSIDRRKTMKNPGSGELPKLSDYLEEEENE